MTWLENALLEFAYGSGIFDFMHSAWGWPVMESIHFTGLSLLIGTVGVFDLRLLGVAREIPIAALHKLVPYGVGGFCLNLVSGVTFLVSAPDQYLYNPAFQTKLAFMLVAAINMVLFYRTVMAEVRALAPDAGAPVRARFMGGISLLCWMMVIICGRLITYYRPPYHWCLWCTG